MAGFDHSPKMVEICRARVAEAEFSVHDLGRPDRLAARWVCRPCAVRAGDAFLWRVAERPRVYSG